MRLWIYVCDESMTGWGWGSRWSLFIDKPQGCPFRKGGGYNDEPGLHPLSVIERHIQRKYKLSWIHNVLCIYFFSAWFYFLHKKSTSYGC